MKNLTFETLSSYGSQHPSVRPVNELAVWTWIAGAVFVVLLLAAVLAPAPDKLTGIPSPATGQLLLPPIGQPAPLHPETLTDPAL